ncbi:MAG: ATP-dependent DNA ligase [Pseudomonadota bacterium]
MQSPIQPMLARAADSIPDTGNFIFEPKWDGLRAIVFRQGGDVLIQGRDLKPLNRWFPELAKALGEVLPRGCVIDGEIVVYTPAGLDFDAVQRRAHAPESRVGWLAKEKAASFVAFDLIAAGGRSVMALSQGERRARLEQLLGSVSSPVYLTPATREREVALDWLARFQGAGLDGVMAKPADAPYQPGKRILFKIKHAHTADCVVAGFRWHKDGQDAVGSLLLGLYDDAGVLQHAGDITGLPAEVRKQLAEEFAPLRTAAPEGQDWEPLRPERVCEVSFDHLQGQVFRDAATLVRWRDDKPAAECRLDQLEVATAAELRKVFGNRKAKSTT